jgi:hypothetical protein
MDFITDTVAGAPDLPPEGEPEQPKAKRQRWGWGAVLGLVNCGWEGGSAQDYPGNLKGWGGAGQTRRGLYGQRGTSGLQGKWGVAW